MSRNEFIKIAEQRKAAFKRLRDAVALLDEQPTEDWSKRNGFHARGAMYLAGYAIECKLKAIAMEVNGCRTLRELRDKWMVGEHEIYSHGLEAIAKKLPLYSRFRLSTVWRDFAGQVNHWRPSWRYDPADHPNRRAAEFIAAVQSVYNWLESNR
jgi:hypothetical protein